MLIEAIRLRHVRRFGASGARVEGLTGGLNVLAAPNESGKTTVVDALHACLTVPHSHRKPVESLVPTAGGSPWIELDIVTPEGAFRVEKQFGQGRLAKVTTRGGAVVAQAADADAWLREAIGADKAGEGPTGLVWVRQDASTEAPDTRGARGEALRGLIGAQVSGVVGGERAQRVMRGARDRLSAYVTDKTGRVAKRGPLGEASARVEELEAEAARLRALTEGTRQTAATLAETEDALAKAEDAGEAARLREAITAAEAALADAVRRDAGLEGLRSEAARAADAAAAADAAKAALRRDVEAARAAEAAARAASEAATATEETAKARTTAAGEAERAAEHAERALSAANAALSAARRGAEAQAAGEALARVEARLAGAKAATEALASLPPAPPAVDLDRLAELADAVTRAAAQAEAARATIQVEAADGLSVNGRSAIVGETIPLTGPVTLTVGAARVVAAPPRAGGAKPEAALAEAGRALDAALSPLGVPDIGVARRLAREGEERALAADAAEADLRRAAPDGLAALEAKARALRGKADAVPTEAPDPDAAEAARAGAEAKASDARGTLRQAERAAGAAREAGIAAAAALAAAHDRAADAGERAGPEETRDARLTAAEDAADRARAAAEAARARLAEAEAALPDLPAARDRIEALREAQANRAKKATGLRERRAELSQALRMDYEGDAAEALSRTEDQLAVAREAEDRQALELEALRLLEGTLGAAHADRLGRFLAPVTAELGPLVDAVFPGAALSLDGELSLDGLRRGEREEALASLSGGTREQLAILTKLAFARLMARNGRSVPLVMDDALVFADDERLGRMFRAVRLAAEDAQVIALTCRADAYEPLGGNAVSLEPLANS